MSFYDTPRRGFLIPDTRFTAANEVTADAVGDEASPRAGGIAEADSATARLVVEATGDQDTDLVLQVEQGGFPKLGSGTRYSYRTSSEASTARRGWNAPNLITGWTAADYSTTANTMVCALALGNGQILVAYRNGSTTAYFQTYTPDTDTWSGTIAFPSTVHATGGIALAQLPEGNVVVLFRDSTGAGSSGGWVIYRYSIADAVSGGSWILHSREPFANTTAPSATGASLRTRLHILPTGEWVFFYGLSNTLWQYASNSHGASFTRVANTTPTASTQFESVVTPSGKIIAVIDVGGFATAYTFASAYTPYDNITGTTIDGTNSTTVDCWLVADPNGRVYFFGRDTSVGSLIRMYYSDDDGATWTGCTWRVFGNADANTYHTAGQCVHAGGAVWMCHQFVDSVATQGGSVCLMQLGGFSSITTISTGAEDSGRLGTGGTTLGTSNAWVPIATMANLAGWSITTAGTAAVTLTGGRQEIACTGGGGTWYASHSTLPADGESYLGAFRVNCSIGGSTTAHQAGLLIRLSTGGSQYEVGVFLTTTAITVRDVTAGSTIGSATGLTLSNDHDILFYFVPGAHLYVAYKLPYQSTWTEIVDTGATTSAATVSRYVRVGTSSSSVTTHSWRYLWVTDDTAAGTVRYASASGATYSDIVGRLLTALPAPIDKRSAYGRRQTYFRGKDGPGRVTDTFQARTRSDFARENILWQQAPSPRIPYKSTSYVTGQTMAWQAAAGVTTSYGSPMLAMAVLNTNAPTHTLHGDPDDGGGYDLLGTLDLTVGFAALTYVRTGNVIRIDGGTKGSRYVMAGEFVGATWYDGTKARRIERHTEGVWNTEGRMVELVLATTGEGAYDGTEGASGTGWIYAHSGVLLIPSASALNYKKLKWTASGGNTVTDAAYRTGKVLIGGVMVMGQQWDWGWTAEYAVPVNDTETRPGSTRRSAVGPSGRTWGVGWTEGVDQTHLRSASTTTIPDFLGLGVGMTDDAREATRGDVPFLLAGLLAQTKGGEVPVVVLPKLPTVATTITDPTLFLYGRIQPELRIENVQGDEGSDEVYRVSAVSVREIT